MSNDPVFKTWLRPCVVAGAPNAHTVWFAVGPQQFCVTPHALETIEEAEWMRDMLHKALVRIADA